MAENIAAAKRITEGDQSVADSIRQMLVDRVAYTCHNHRILQIFHEEEAELPKRLMNQVIQSRRAYQTVMTDLLERGLAEGLFQFAATPMIAANCLLGACNWSYKWYNPDGAKSPEQLAEEVAELLMGALVAYVKAPTRQSASGASARSLLRARART
jgi:hypothetical protein